jgi:hypothetical protein
VKRSKLARQDNGFLLQLVDWAAGDSSMTHRQIMMLGTRFARFPFRLHLFLVVCLFEMGGVGPCLMVYAREASV